VTFSDHENYCSLSTSLRKCYFICFKTSQFPKRVALNAITVLSFQDGHYRNHLNTKWSQHIKTAQCISRNACVGRRSRVGKSVCCSLWQPL